MHFQLLRKGINKFLKGHGKKVNHAGWQIHIFGDGINSDYTMLDNLSEVSRLIDNPTNILKEDHRSFVATFEYENDKYVIKRFTLQNTWFWFRWTSLLFESLGETAYKNSILMLEEGLLTPSPVMLWQKRSNYSIIHSWMIYRYMNGEPLTSDDAGEIVDYVKTMHLRGWLHRDPHPANFIRTEKGIATIDPLRVTKSNNIYLRACDLLHMMRDMPSADKLYADDELIFWLKIAQIGHNIIKTYRFVKHKARAILGYDPHKILINTATNDNSDKDREY